MSNPYPPNTPPPNTPGGQASDQAKGFFAALFDFNFHTLVTPKIIKVVYVIGTAAILFTALLVIISGLVSGEAIVVIGSIILAPIVALIYLALFRMTLEMYFAVVRMSEDIHHRLPRG